MKTLELTRIGLSLATFAVLLMFKMSWPFCLLFAAIPFLAMTWVINLRKGDVHHFYFVMRRLAVMLVVLPSLAMVALCALTGSFFGLVIALPLLGFAIWLVIHLGKKIGASSAGTQMTKLRDDQDWWAARHQTEDRREREDQTERNRKLDEAARLRMQAEFEKSNRQINSELDAIKNARLSSN